MSQGISTSWRITRTSAQQLVEHTQLEQALGQVREVREQLSEVLRQVK